MPSEQELEQLIRESQLTTSGEADERMMNAVKSRLSRDQMSSLSGARVSSEADGPASVERGLPVGQTPAGGHDVVRRRLRSIVPSITVLAVLLLLGIWWVFRPTDSWAQVVRAVQEKPWIHLTGKTPDGDSIEEWFSIQHQISAHRAASHVSLSNFRKGLAEFYSPSTNEIVRSDADARSSQRRSFDAFTSLFQGLFRGDERLDLEKAFGHMPDIAKIEQSRREIKDGEARWYEYDITLQPADAADQKSSSITIRVDAASMLPQTMTMVDGQHSASMTFRFEFPESGPEDIYALGVPRDTKIVDQTPQALTGELKKIVDGIRAAAEGFDDYRAIFVMSKPEHPWHVGTPFLIWRKGVRTRSEIGSVDPDNPPSVKTPDNQTDQVRWWKDRCSQLWFSPVEIGDGKTLFKNHYIPPGVEYTRVSDHPTVRSPAIWGKTDWKEQPEPRTWPARTTPILWAYPQNLSGYLTYPQYESEVISDPADAPAGTVLIKGHWDSGRIPAANSGTGSEIPAMRNDVEYLVDPSKSFVVLRHSTQTYAEENGERKLQTRISTTHGDFRQSPKGFWYPTVIRDEQTFLHDDKLKTINTVSRYYLDFDVEIPDNLFEPRKRDEPAFPD